MAPIFHLIIHNISAIVSAVTAVGVALFIFLNGKRQTANITFALVFFSTAIFYVSHVVGVNVVDPELSRQAFMWNLVIFFIGAFNLHAVLAALNKHKEHEILIACTYVFAIVATIFFILFPDLFLLPSVSKMYFQNYYVPGVFNWIRIVYLYVLIVPYCIYELYVAYKKTLVVSEKKQLKYFMLTMLVGYSSALLPNFLIYNIEIDPIWGILFVVLCSFPLIYGALKYELFNVQVIAKQAFLYSLAVGAVGGFISLLNFSSTLIAREYPGFPTWSLSLVSAVLAVSAAVIVWKGLREGDLMKAEFITTVTHKFRTPLTYIKWATDNLVSPDLSLEDRKAQVEYIRAANEKLVELTNILTTASDAENKGYEYNLKREDVSKVVEEVTGTLTEHLKIKELSLVKNLEPNLFAKFDETRLKFVIQVLFENALHYSFEKGTITVSTSATHKEVVVSVTDTGVGMNQTQLELLFTKFFRSDAARKADTEGMGIGLYVSNKIIEKLQGRIWAESAGEKKGSSFHFALPRVK
jgi:signal transduction histidine kinase